MKKTHHAFKRFLVRLLGNERTQGVTVALFCIFLSLLVGALLLLSLGKNPLLAYKSILQGAGFWPKARYAGHKSILTDFMSLLDYVTPMLFASLSIAVAFKSGLFNICVPGMMIFSGFIASILIGYSTLPPLIARILVVLVGMGCGALLGGLIGFLKHRFNTNEVVSSIMLNYIVAYVVSFFIQTRFVDPLTRQSLKINDSARLTLTDVVAGNLKMDISLILPLGILLVFLLKFMMDRTRLGFELKAVGLNPKAARYSGMNVGKTVILAMVLSGALAGLAGVSYFMGTFASIQPKVIPALGFDAIAVSLLGNSSPIGCFFASLLVTTITNGTTYMSSQVGVLREIASLITGILLLFSACSGFIRQQVRRYKSEFEDEKLEREEENV
ncbi:ABC transporter permease [uncultured Sphaerochaeta sp.]|uniref:ABC transporter permease n=1 Tax=uncultured Sphaerochaeta sp. TaxID=886478 RepID=UPI002A0A77A4|nr:ABC transporter permease [uncultured Sphaerochaeta sp.]